jgi:hypothetical protein
LTETEQKFTITGPIIIKKEIYEGITRYTTIFDKVREDKREFYQKIFIEREVILRDEVNKMLEDMEKTLDDLIKNFDDKRERIILLLALEDKIKDAWEKSNITNNYRSKLLAKLRISIENLNYKDFEKAQIISLKKIIREVIDSYSYMSEDKFRQISKQLIDIKMEPIPVIDE